MVSPSMFLLGSSGATVWVQKYKASVYSSLCEVYTVVSRTETHADRGICSKKEGTENPGRNPSFPSSDFGYHFSAHDARYSFSPKWTDSVKLSIISRDPGEKAQVR